MCCFQLQDSCPIPVQPTLASAEIACDNVIVLWEGYTIGTRMDLVAQCSCLHLPLTLRKSAELRHAALNQDPCSAGEK
ncbi:hypothetical protein DNTS_006401 [Danionella cerebrum]|uniref:Uncharacterized protein n=1 Tax=Danionella cerebrum TaxID=2873325 RepID=A0A553RCT6_9TELE|nr:hypothetical protein DNTS_006401 [Danionella translucida]